MFIVRKRIAEKYRILNFKGLLEFSIDEENFKISISWLEIYICGFFAKGLCFGEERSLIGNDAKVWKNLDISLTLTKINRIDALISEGLFQKATRLMGCENRDNQQDDNCFFHVDVWYYYNLLINDHISFE